MSRFGGKKGGVKPNAQSVLALLCTVGALCLAVLTGVLGQGAEGDLPPLRSIVGDEVAFSTLTRNNKAILIVNVASECGYTEDNYEELNELYEEYKPKGLEVLAFPCNQFGGQEPGSGPDILRFAKSQGATFPLMAKVEVNGANAHPLFRYLKAESGDTSDIPWNFSKFLLKGSDVIKRYHHGIDFEDIERDIQSALGVSEGKSGGDL